MEFTYAAYRNLILLLHTHGYDIRNYHNYEKSPRSAILRHDIDIDIEKAVRFAQMEHEVGVSSTYFVLLTSDFYNVFSRKNTRSLDKICELGHEVGLHFDETKYNGGDRVQQILEEIAALEQCLHRQVTSVSMHRPSSRTLDADYCIGGAIVNSYGEEFFSRFKYVSDSRRFWRENVEQIICSEEYPRLHILTHAFWYDEEEVSIEETLQRFVAVAPEERYQSLDENFSDLGSVLTLADVYRSVCKHGEEKNYL